jgi:hypothetical protein
VARGYAPEFRRRVIALVRGGRSVSVVAAEIGVSEATVYRWRARDRVDRGERPGLPSADRSELAICKRADQIWLLRCGRRHPALGARVPSRAPDREARTRRRKRPIAARVGRSPLSSAEMRSFPVAITGPRDAGGTRSAASAAQTRRLVESRVRRLACHACRGRGALASYPAVHARSARGERRPVGGPIVVQPRWMLGRGGHQDRPPVREEGPRRS